ncbi:pilus assembly protein [Sulfurivermis fontis]|uniref:pilus assembly protein n=1 Tax=Sulfurivermis fontis TaxID=1972068 RepID=UPI000FD9577C|nr:PilC/PilY family type IV pilus protein [Sulfurivermis fontis]
MKTHMTHLRSIKGLTLGLALGLVTVAPAQAQVDIASSPLFVTSSIEPNIMFILDDSGSMQWEIMPDEHISNEAYYMYGRINYLYGSNVGYTDRAPSFADGDVYGAFTRTAQFNPMYYDPAITYTPWPQAANNGALMPNADPAAAYHNPLRPARGTRNLTANNTRNASWRNCTTITRDAVTNVFSFSGCTSFTASQTFWPAVYFVHDGSTNYAWTNFTKVEIRSTTATYTGHGRENRSDCAAAPTCTYAEEIQNFANWYTYYRSRILAARGGVSRAFAQQGEGMRVGYATINAGWSTVDGVGTSKIVRGVRHFAGTDREQFFNLLYDRDIPAAGTPLRLSLQAAGNYFSRTDNRGPWGANPGTNDTTPHLQCRQSYSILTTDGYWNGSDPSGIGNSDDANGPVHTAPDGSTFQYIPKDPYRDGNTNTLADVAMHYWKNDLRTDLANEVPTNPQNEAFWQHMVTFGIGLGVTGSIVPQDAWDAVTNETAISWPNPFGSSPAKIDDLLHASINSRGGFFNAGDPETFATQLNEVLDAIVARVESSATAAAASSAFLHTGTKLYTAGFRSGDWSGMLSAHNINPDGSLGSIAWDAEAQLRATTPASRNIFTRNSTTNATVALELANLSTAQQTALNRSLTNTTDSLGANRIDWLRGNDAAHASFRNRSGSGELRLLGDIINSNPQFSGNIDFGYRLLEGTEGTSYITFRTTAPVTTRPDMIYVAANDGMLHAFHGETGEEVFAYMPSTLLLPEGTDTFARINRLMDPDYTHRYFMDGTVAVGDAYATSWANGGSAGWRTVVVGSMGAGGRTVYALDVTDPTSSGNKVLWEFNDADLGYNVGQPTIARMMNGDWAAIFGNGYNSANHRAVLYIVRLRDGALLSKVDTGIGSAATPNGMASPLASDWTEGDMITRRIYAGDLQGNLWRFDVSGNQSQWSHSSNRMVLFQARDAGGTPQPITTRPGARPLLNVEYNPLMVVFGTGSFFRDQDSTSTQVQTLYGIIDNATLVNRNELLQQEITWQGDVTFGSYTYTVRTVSSNDALATHKGWYLDLIYAGNAEGERVISAPTFPTGLTQNRVRFSTLIPNNDPCSSGRSGFIMDLMLSDGGANQLAVYDLNRDGYFTDSENYSGLGGGTGEELVTIRDAGIERGYLGDGTVLPPMSIGGKEGRESWKQLRPAIDD